MNDNLTTNASNEAESPAFLVGAVMRCPSKLILENQTDLPMVDFLRLAQEVVSMGRISNDDKQYCYLTSFTIDGQEYHIVSDLNEKSDKLTFYKRPS
jgi:myo-inositol-hexaphosphate 3-phosphohydrolase